MKEAKEYDGSKPLKNLRHEAFCQHYAGDCWGYAAKAYLKIYKAKSSGAAHVGAHHLFNDYPEIQKRIEYIRQQNFKLIQMDREEILQILSDIARGKLQDFVSRDGGISIHGKRNERAVESLEVVEHLDGETPKRIRKIKLRNPVDAIERICRITGLDSAQKVDLCGSVLVIK